MYKVGKRSCSFSLSFSLNFCLFYFLFPSLSLLLLSLLLLSLLLLSLSLDPVMIVDHPASRTHPAGFSFIDLTCRATGLPVPSIYWYKDGVLLVDDGDHIQITDNDYELSDFGINFGRLHIVDVVLRCNTESSVKIVTLKYRLLLVRIVI